jgi:hypothetical protein
MHPSTRRARELLNRLAVKEAAWEAERASRDPFEPDAQEAWQAAKDEPKLKTVRDFHVSTEDFEARISELRAELVSLIEDAIAAFRDELDEFADGVGEEVGKMNRQLDKLEEALSKFPNEKLAPRLVKSNDAA